MKNLFYLLCVLTMISATACQTQSKLDKAKSKMFSIKLKEYKAEGWKILSSTNTLEVALMEHYEALKNSDNQELVGEVSNYVSTNVGRQAAFNNAVIMYGNMAGSTP